MSLHQTSLMPRVTSSHNEQGRGVFLNLPPGASGPKRRRRSLTGERAGDIAGGERSRGGGKGQEKGTSHLCVYALSSQGLMTSMREESIPSRAISESRQNRDTRCSRWVPDFCHRCATTEEERDALWERNRGDASSEGDARSKARRPPLEGALTSLS